MALKNVIEVLDLFDSKYVNGARVADFLSSKGINDISLNTISEDVGKTDFIKVIIPGEEGKQNGGNAPTLGIIGRLGGIGARPERTGLVSDADGALIAIATAAKVGTMMRNGDRLQGDLIIATHICPDAPILEHEPVPFMNSPVEMTTMNKYEVDERMDAILSIDATKGNKVMNDRGIAITPTVKEGYILNISADLLDVLAIVSGDYPRVLPITTLDITPYGNGLYHINSIMQPAVVTDKPVVGVATIAKNAIPGSASGANYFSDIELGVRFCIEVAKGFTGREIKFYNPEDFQKITGLYGKMNHLQTLGKGT